MDFAHVIRRVAKAAMADEVIDKSAMDELRRAVTTTLADEGVTAQFNMQYIPREKGDVMEQFFVTTASQGPKFTFNVWDDGEVSLYEVPRESTSCIVHTP